MKPERWFLLQSTNKKPRFDVYAASGKLRANALNLAVCGIDSPHWYRKMRNWIWEQKLIDPNGTLVLQAAMDHLEYLLLMRTRLDAQLRILAVSPRHKATTELLCSLPGIGRHTAISMIRELGDISRFYSLDQLCNYIGLVPATHNSGDTVRQGRLTYRGHRTLRSLLIESAWTAVRIDPALSLAFTELKKRMVSQKAIVRIARKLLSRIRYVLTHQEKCELGIVQ